MPIIIFFKLLFIQLSTHISLFFFFLFFKRRCDICIKSYLISSFLFLYFLSKSLAEDMVCLVHVLVALINAYYTRKVVLYSL